MGVAWVVATHQAADKTEFLLDYSTLDMRDTVSGAVDAMLFNTTKSLAHEFGSAAPHSVEELRASAASRELDELNIVDSTGHIIASSDPSCIGIDMALKPETREFNALLKTGSPPAVSQRFRRNAYGTERRKYLAVAFSGGAGYLQVGIDESRLAALLPTLLGFIFDEWILGETGCFLCADLATGKLVSNPSRHRNEAKTLAETGFDASAAPCADEPLPDVAGLESGVTFVQRVFGEKCFCRSYVYAGHRMASIVPAREYYSHRDFLTAVLGILLLAVFGAFAWFADRIFRDSARLKAFYAAEDSRRAKDMEIAGTIQKADLPVPLQDSDSFRIHADMQPARDVGGDFYDFFRIDAGHVAFLAADVSGKGITAALYMMNARTLLKDALLAEPAFNPAAALTQVNAELCRNNPAEMFITAWVGVLDLENGRVAFANAGHNPPLRLRNNELPEWLRERSGCPLACFDAVKYRLFETSLAPGEMLFLYTDGVTEAMNQDGELYGDGRLVNSIVGATAGKPAAVTPDFLDQSVRDNVKLFAEEAPQADDLTVLVVQYVGAVERYMMTFSCDEKALSATREYLEMRLENCGCTSPEREQLLIALDEVVSNVVRCSGASGIALEVRFSRAKKGVTVSVSDDGKPFNPLQMPEPDTKLALEDRPTGGLGILLLRKIMDSLDYRYAHGCNIVSFRKNFGGKGKPA